ncbi:50S ribosomal protein L21 [Candidatus Gottesmanbacteria bacterium]|nr:50S ribosomal protein L21 [Candidatus Gottesmanbacteria bacterium]
MFAVVRIAGKQYTVRPDQKILVDSLAGGEGDAVTFDEVLLLVDEKKTSVGTPTLKDVSVRAKIIKQQKGDKVDVLRYKSKVRHRRHIGFRAHLTELQILAIGKA